MREQADQHLQAQDQTCTEQQTQIQWLMAEVSTLKVWAITIENGPHIVAQETRTSISELENAIQELTENCRPETR